MNDQLRQRITDTIAKDRVMLFMKGNPQMPQCGFSAAVVGMLKETGATFGSYNILADPEARMLEFGRGLQFPVETAIKTGTSTDYRDAWAIAFDYQHTIAVWMGNLDGSAMDGVTGAVGAETQSAAAAKAFIDFLSGPEAAPHFKSKGFQTGL